MDLKKKKLKWFFVLKKVFENQLHKLGPTERANLFPCVFDKPGLILIITSETELEILGHVVQMFLSKRV